MNAAIYPNFKKANALECTKNVCGILHGMGFSVFADERFRTELNGLNFLNFGRFEEFIKAADIAVAIGGDGTILRCARAMHGLETRLLGINTGRLGFMASLEFDELDGLSRLAEGEVSRRMMLDFTVSGGDVTTKNTALNDIIISRLYSKICDFRVCADGELIGEYRADGVVFSTPTGSTAYSLSAGGPIIEPDLDAIEMTLICPHSLFARPMLFSPKRVLKVEHFAADEPFVYISADGGKPLRFSSGETVVVKKSEFAVNLIDLKPNTFFDSVNKKLMRAIQGTQEINVQNLV